jgi:hypothetical protein
LTKSLSCNVAAFIGMPYILESSAIQSLFLWYGNNLIMTSCSVTCFKKAISEMCFKKFKEDSVQNSKSKKLDPKLPFGRPSIMSGHSSVNNISPDDEAILSGLQSVSRSFEKFKVASVWTSWQHARTLFRVPDESRVQVHPSGRRGNTVQTPVSVRQVKGFPLQTQIWEDNCNHQDAILDKARRGEEFQ